MRRSILIFLLLPILLFSQDTRRINNNTWLPEELTIKREVGTPDFSKFQWAPCSQIVIFNKGNTKKFIIDFSGDTLKCYGTMKADSAAKIFYKYLIAEHVKQLAKLKQQKGLDDE